VASPGQWFLENWTGNCFIIFYNAIQTGAPAKRMIYELVAIVTNDAMDVKHARPVGLGGGSCKTAGKPGLQTNIRDSFESCFVFSDISLPAPTGSPKSALVSKVAWWCFRSAEKLRCQALLCQLISTAVFTP
jgi:hypothetical protein